MLVFKLNEIPKGKSESVITLPDDFFDLDGFSYQDLTLNVNFEKREYTLQIGFSFETEVKLVCDRSLEEFWQVIDGQYAILFKDGADFEVEEADMAVRRLDISGNIINIEAEVRDTVLLSIPLRKLHPRFIDENGNVTDFELKTGEVETIDPRWEALKSIKQNITNN